MQFYGVRHLFSLPYHAQSNGTAENAVKKIKLALKRAYQDNKNLDQAMYLYLFDYRNTEHTTTGSSPALLMFGRELKSRLHLNNINKNVRNQIDNYKGSANKALDLGSPFLVKHYANPPTWTPGEIENKKGNVTYDVRVGKDTVLRKQVDQLIPRRSLYLPSPNLNVDARKEGQTDSSIPVSDQVNSQLKVNEQISGEQSKSSGETTSRYFLRSREESNK